MLAFDTNLLFYATNRDSPFHSGALAFLRSLQADPRVVISEFALVELYCLLRNPTINQHPLRPAQAARVIAAYRQHPHWRLVGFPAESRPLHDQLWQTVAADGFAYRRIYDARLALSLLGQGVTEFATVNTKDFGGFAFSRVFNPLDTGV